MLHSSTLHAAIFTALLSLFTLAPLLLTSSAVEASNNPDVARLTLDLKLSGTPSSDALIKERVLEPLEEWGKEHSIKPSSLHIETWETPGSTLPSGLCTLHFQWKAGLYAEHKNGFANLVSQCDQETPNIISSVMIPQRSVQEPKETTPPVSSTTLPTAKPPSPAKNKQDTWRDLNPRGNNYTEVLQNLPQDPSTKRTLALELIEEGNFDCKEFTAESGCNEDFFYWSDLSASADIDDPCLRRNLLLWAISSGALQSQDFEKHLPFFQTLIKEYDGPNLDLAKAALQGTLLLDEETRVFFLQSAPEHLTNTLLSNLSDEALRHLYQKSGFDHAIFFLSVTPQNTPTLLRSLHDERLEIETRLDTLKRLNSAPHLQQNRHAILLSITDTDPCALAMFAASELSALGDNTRLPQNLPNTSPLQQTRALCLASHDPNTPRALSVWRSLISNTGLDLSGEIDSSDHISSQEFSTSEIPSPLESYIFSSSTSGTSKPDPEIYLNDSSGQMQIFTFQLNDEGVWSLKEMFTEYEGCSC